MGWGFKWLYNCTQVETDSPDREGISAFIDEGGLDFTQAWVRHHDKYPR